METCYDETKTVNNYSTVIVINSACYFKHETVTTYKNFERIYFAPQGVVSCGDAGKTEDKYGQKNVITKDLNGRSGKCGFEALRGLRAHARFRRNQRAYVRKRRGYKQSCAYDVFVSPYSLRRRFPYAHTSGLSNRRHH